MRAAEHLTSLSVIEREIRSRDYHRALEAIRRLRLGTGLDASSMTQLDVLESECLAFTGDSRTAESLCRSATVTLRRSDQHSLYARACFVLAVCKCFAGALEEAIESAQIALHAYLRDGDEEGAIRCLNWLGNIFFDKSDLVQSLRVYTQCVERAESAGLQRSAAVARLNMGLPYALSGELNHAEEQLRLNRPELTEHADQLNVMRSDLVRAFVLIQLRRFEDARTELSALAVQMRGPSYKRESGAWHEYMGELELASGNPDSAARYLCRGIELASVDSMDESVIGQSRRLLAEARLAQGRLEDALAEGKRALESIRKVGERFEEGVVHRVIAEVYVRRGEAVRAREEFARSMETLRLIGARLEWAKSCLAAGSCSLYSQRDRLGYLIEAERLFEDVGVAYWTDATRAQLERLLPGRSLAVSAGVPAEAAPECSAVFVTEHAETRELLNLVGKLAQRPIAILITGETGTGKDQLARHIHSVSPCRDRPMVEIDLNVIPESLWESELFGSRRGAFTGASGERIGLLESANGGTVFLNEIGNLPMGLQAKLLEFLDTRQIRRLGDPKPVALNVRLIAATNRPLLEAVARGDFRSDLYYRLEEAPLHLRPLRERREDILPLIRHFLVEFGVPEEDCANLRTQPWLARALGGYWKGNARQLRNFVRRLVAIAQSPRDPDFSSWADKLLDQMDEPVESESARRVSRERLIESLDRSQWNQRAAARLLGITEGGVRHLMKRMAIERPVLVAARFGT